MSDSTSTAAKFVGQAWPGETWRDLHVTVALSGGADSVALLRAVMEIKQQVTGAGSVTALHVNHQLRSAESDADAAWCQQLCQSLGVPLTVLTGDAAQRAATDGDGIEAAARAERYELLAGATEQLGARYLATAHTSDDQAETVLLRMLRGAGLRGASGIPRSRVLTPSLTLVRPLLACSREVLIEYLTELGQAYRTDSTNVETQYTRNRVRNELLPLLREHYNPEVDDALRRFASQAEDAQQLIESLGEDLLSRAELRSSDAQLSLQLGPLCGEATIVVCEALRIAWRNAKLPEQAMTYHWWRRLAEMADGTIQGKTLNLPGGVRASTTEGRLCLQW
jgi:tRNA(Ile)-lysidine synthase